MAGIAAVVVYVIGDLLSALLYNGYSYLDQAISERVLSDPQFGL